jgi:hypothetical protein
MGRWMDKAKEMEAARTMEESLPPAIVPLGQNDGQGSESAETTDTTHPRFTPGQRVFLDSHARPVRAGMVEYAPTLEAMRSGRKEWWYIVRVDNRTLTYAHESLLRYAGVARKIRVE